MSGGRRGLVALLVADDEPAIRFVTEAPREEPDGTVAVFQDLCGNRRGLIGRRAAD